MADPTKIPRLTDRKRAAIIAAAVSEFQKHGFDGTSMDRVADAAGASKRTVYNHFKSKEELFEAIIEDLRSGFGQIENVPYSAEEDLETQLIAIGVRIAEATMSEDSIKLARVVVSRFIQSPEFAAATMKEQENYHQGLEKWIKAATKDGRLSVGNVEQAATEFVGLIKTFCFWPQLISGSPPPTKRKLNAVIRSSAEMFLCRYG